MRLHFIRDIKKSGTPCRPFDGTKCYVDTGSVSRTNINSATEVGFADKPSRANLSASVGDVLFAKMQGTTKVLLINDELSSNIYSTGFYAFKDPRIEPNFLRYFFLSPGFNMEKDRLSKGATMKAINDDGMAQISISVPSLSRQKEITAELDAIEKSIKLSNAQISLLDYQVKSLFIKRRAVA
jgi:type I restriction enzyme S subunit